MSTDCGSFGSCHKTSLQVEIHLQEEFKCVSMLIQIDAWSGSLMLELQWSQFLREHLFKVKTISTQDIHYSNNKVQRFRFSFGIWCPVCPLALLLFVYFLCQGECINRVLSSRLWVLRRRTPSTGKRGFFGSLNTTLYNYPAVLNAAL